MSKKFKLIPHSKYSTIVIIMTILTWIFIFMLYKYTVSQIIKQNQNETVINHK